MTGDTLYITNSVNIQRNKQLQIVSLKFKIMKSFLFSIALFFASFAIQAQETTDKKQNDEELIKETIGLYFEGWMTGDTTKIGMAMHSTCHLKFIKNEKVTMFNRGNSEGSIVSINITRTAAAAKCKIDTPKREYIDYFNMLKVDGRWYIVDKISSSKAK